MQTVITHLAAVALGSGLVLLAGWLTGRQQNGTSRYLQRQDARARAVLEADRARLLNLLLAKTPVEAAQLQWTSPAQPPPPDPELAADAGPDPAGLYTPDLNELGWDETDDAALRAARH
jgi:hypothetical protein